jgi:hypothetical protein
MGMLLHRCGIDFTSSRVDRQKMTCSNIISSDGGKPSEKNRQDSHFSRYPQQVPDLGHICSGCQHNASGPHPTAGPAAFPFRGHKTSLDQESDGHRQAVFRPHARMQAAGDSSLIERSEDRPTHKSQVGISRR